MDISDIIDKNWEDLLKDKNLTQRNRIGLTLHKLKDSLKRLQLRYTECSEIEEHIANDSSGPKRDNLSLMQLQLLDKIEAFYQQVYVTLSTLILVVNHLGIKRKRTTHPIKSVKRFLEFVESKFNEKFFTENTNYLLESVDFRAKFIDHPQQHILHDWMTYSYNTESYIIYYTSKSTKVIYRGSVGNPFDPMFMPPVDCDEFYVSPPKARTYKSVIYLVKNLLSLST